ncbi:MAG TPA: FadR/GntR family transcriptional regulator [Candidatus Deferrimicrobium sp.]|nr:FadR/GntR family transcriptional regulator [Candidatus Deferrimicrobium sp.]
MYELHGDRTPPTIGGPTGIHAGVVQAIGRQIVRGELAAGEILPEQGELSRILGVSRTVVREATKVLATKGLVESRSKRGTAVLPRSGWRLLDPDVLAWLTEAGPDPDFLRSVFEVRRIIEPAAARLAAERASAPELAAIEEALEAMATADDGAAYLAADVRYHEILVAATHNDHLVQLVAAFGPAFQAGLRAATRNVRPWPDFHESGLSHHRDVLDAVTAHDVERAGRAMEWLVDQSLDERILGYSSSG